MLDSSGATSAPRRKQRIEGLDVLRGVAVALVMVCHAWPQAFDGAGIVGVTMFFTLSGYLITGLLLADLQRHGRFRAMRFFAHRACRLLPALVGLQLGYVLLAAAADRSPSAAQTVQNWVVGLFYLSDLPIGRLSPTEGLAHLWTLSVEEQFYLVWPWLLLFMVTARRVKLTLAIVAAALVLVSLATPATGLFSAHQIYQSPTTWAITLLAGATAALLKDGIARLLDHRGLWAAGAVVLALAVFAPEADQHVWRMLLLGPVVAVSTLALILRAEQVAVVGGAWRPLLRLGTVSYGVYLWNYPIAVMLPPADNTNMPLAWGALSIVLSIAAAAGSWYTVEAVGRWLRRRFDAAQGQARAPSPQAVDVRASGSRPAARV